MSVTWYGMVLAYSSYGVTYTQKVWTSVTISGQKTFVDRLRLALIARKIH